jgi:Protein of unknown function (DUF1176)
MNRGRLKTACVSFIVLLILAASAAAQDVPRKKQNLTRDDREAWRKVLRWPDEYEKAWSNTHDSGDADYGGLAFHRLGRGKYLVEVNTYPGAYQSGYIFMLYDEAKKPTGPARLLKLKVFGEDERGRPSPSFEEEVAGLPTFNAATRQLEIFSKYRGPGDCGSIIRYKFVNDSPVVVEAREQDCDDNRKQDEINPRQWPRKKL